MEHARVSEVEAREHHRHERGAEARRDLGAQHGDEVLVVQRLEDRLDEPQIGEASARPRARDGLGDVPHAPFARARERVGELRDGVRVAARTELGKETKRRELLAFGRRRGLREAGPDLRELEREGHELARVVDVVPTPRAPSVRRASRTRAAPSRRACGRARRATPCLEAAPRRRAPDARPRRAAVRRRRRAVSASRAAWRTPFAIYDDVHAPGNLLSSDASNHCACHFSCTDTFAMTRLTASTSATSATSRNISLRR